MASESGSRGQSTALAEDALTLDDLPEMDMADNDSFVIDDDFNTIPSLDQLSEDTVIDHMSYSDHVSEHSTSENDSPWVDDIISSEDLPSDEPELDEIDALLGGKEKIAQLDSELDTAESIPINLLPAAETESSIPVEYHPESEDLEIIDTNSPENKESHSVSESENINENPDLELNINENVEDTDDIINLNEDELEHVSEMLDDDNDSSDHLNQETDFNTEIDSAKPSKEILSEDNTPKVKENIPVKSNTDTIPDISKPKGDHYFGLTEIEEAGVTLSDEELGGILHESDETNKDVIASEYSKENDITLSKNKADGILEDHDQILDSALTDEDQVEEVTLSESELDGILEDVEETPPALSDEPAEEEAEVTLSDSELDGILEDVEQTPALSDEHAEEEAEVTLSDSELDGILEDVEQTPALTDEPAEEEAEVTLSDSELDGILEDVDDTSALESDEPAEEEAEVTLSDSELDGILEDIDESQSVNSYKNKNDAEDVLPPPNALPGTDELLSLRNIKDELSDEDISESSFEENLHDENVIKDEEPNTDDFFTDDSEEGPITLTDDELDGILEKAVIENVEDQATPDQTDDFFTDDSEVGPITLSDDELAGIMADASKEEFKAAPVEKSIDSGEINAGDTDSYLKPDEEPVEISEEEIREFMPDASQKAPLAEYTPDETLLEEDPASGKLGVAESRIPEDEEDSPIAHHTEKIENEPAAISDDEAELDLNDSDSLPAVPARDELREMIAYLDTLLGELPEDTIRTFAQSEYFKLYQKVMIQLGL